MKQLKCYSLKTTIEFYDEVIENKSNTQRDPTYINRLASLRDVITEKFDAYDECFNENSLEKLVSHGYVDPNKTDLLKLYRYKNSVLQKLKATVTTTQTNRIISTCQNCTISEINSFDHYVPKDTFSEFVVNPKNLIPSCTKCNSYKSEIWKENDKRLFLNLYLDDLPQESYLFANVTIDADISLAATFYLNNPNSIDNDLFELITNHYTKLNLLKRFSENIDQVVTPLTNTMKSYVNRLPIRNIVEAQLEKIEKDKIAFGYNNWKSVLEDSLVRNDEYIEKIIQV